MLTPSSSEQKQRIPTQTKKADVTSAKKQAFGRTKRESSRLIHRRTISHAELCAEVLGEESDCVSIGVRIALRQVLHGLYQQLLTFDIASVADSRRTTPLWFGDYRDRQYSGHGYQILYEGRY